MRVYAAGGIHVIGDVETAFLDAEGDIVIAGGLLGTARSRCGSVACKFAQGARLDAPRGDVSVRESAMQTHIRSGRSAFVGDILLGGTCYAENLVEARIAGSESGVPTVLVAGRNQRLSEGVEDDPHTRRARRGGDARSRTPSAAPCCPPRRLGPSCPSPTACASGAR